MNIPPETTALPRNPSRSLQTPLAKSLSGLLSSTAHCLGFLPIHAALSHWRLCGARFSHRDSMFPAA